MKYTYIEIQRCWNTYLSCAVSLQMHLIIKYAVNKQMFTISKLLFKNKNRWSHNWKYPNYNFPYWTDFQQTQDKNSSTQKSVQIQLFTYSSDHFCLIQSRFSQMNTKFGLHINKMATFQQTQHFNNN